MKKLRNPFLVLFLIGFLIFNWDSVSWLFNYKVVFGSASDFLKNTFAAESPQDFTDSGEKTEPAEKIGSLEISKLNVSAPLVFVDDASLVQKSLNRGAVHWPESDLPGSPGQTLILGHSAPPNWPKIRYDGVFSRISELKQGDEISVVFNGKNYSYRVTKQIFLERGEEIPENDENQTSSIYLITCWPPGKDIRRLAVEAQLY